MSKWPQLTPRDIRELTPEQASDLLVDKTVTFKNRDEYNKWFRQRPKR
jgi:hypothetical protein